MRKTKWRAVLVALIAWLMAVMLSGCMVKLDSGIGEWEGQISEKQIQVDISETDGMDEGQTDIETQRKEQAAPWSENESLDSEEKLAPEEIDDIHQDESYTGKDQVALYLHIYGKLPNNYITKREAQDMGWDSSKGNLEEVAPGKSIGGSRFGNREGLLPEKDGRSYYECDIDYDGGYRGGKRIVYSDDGLIYYTEDHYKTFELLYTSEGKAE